MAPAVEVNELVRVYGAAPGLFRAARPGRTAVDRVSFSVAPGELFGLLGANGAGKTTTIRMLTTLLLPTAGAARVLGLDVVARPVDVRRRIGFVYGGDRGLYSRVSAWENMVYFAHLYGLSPAAARRRTAELLEQVGLGGRAHDKVERFSRGMKQRLHIARALVHDPDVLFLDEPTIGIDPVGARELREVVLGLRRQGKTIVLTTHNMPEADALCDRIAIMAQGRIVAAGTPRELRSQAAEADPATGLSEPTLEDAYVRIVTAGGKEANPPAAS